MISPTRRSLDLSLGGGFVAMVDRGRFDPYLRDRAYAAGAVPVAGCFLWIERDANGTHVVYREKETREQKRLSTKLVIGADGARSEVARSELAGSDDLPHVVAYQEIIEVPCPKLGVGYAYDPGRCDVIYNGQVSPDFYGWIFPQGDHVSVGVATGVESVDVRAAAAALRVSTGLEHCGTLRKEGGCIPLMPLKRWDNGRDVVLAGDAAGVVAPSSGEGIYYAMACGRAAAVAADRFIASAQPRDLKLARQIFMKDHSSVFRLLRDLQGTYYRSDERRERFVSLCHDAELQRVSWQSYMNKTRVRAGSLTRLRMGWKSFAHLARLVPPART